MVATQPFLFYLQADSNTFLNSASHKLHLYYKQYQMANFAIQLLG
jgi:hypothetical protein